MYEDIINTYIIRYVYDRDDAFWQVADLEWHLFPWVIMFLAVILILIGALKGREVGVKG